MNRALQPDLHPDAESLNAFMEQALPQPERAQILDHIAACSQCRQVVFLSQQATEDTPVAVPATSLPDAWFRNWHLNWRLAWAPAAAFALVVALAIALHMRHTPGQTEMARITPPAQIVSPTPTPREIVPEAAPRQPAPARTLKSGKTSASSAEMPEQASAFVPPSSYSGAVAGEVGGASQVYSERAQTDRASSVFGQGDPANAPAEPKPEPAVAAWKEQQRVAEQLSSAAQEARTSQARFGIKAEQAQASRAVAPAAAQGMGAKSVGTGSFELSAPRSGSYDVAVTRAEVAKLPSGLAPVSIATAQHHTVAIDQAGTLFVRESSSGKWEPVVRQWTGRAVRVRVQRVSGSSAGGNAAGNAASQPAPPAVPATLEIVNDSNLVWVSQDGKTWNAR